MVLHYCEKCGLRIPSADVESGAVRINEEGKAICSKCAPARRGSDRVQVGATPRDSRMGIKPVGRATKIHIPPAEPTTVPVEAAVPVPEVPQTAPGKRKLLLVGGSVAIFALIVVLALVFGSSKSDAPRETAGEEPAATVPVLPPVLAPNIPPSVPQPPVDTRDEGKKEPDGYDPRAAFAQSLLEQAKAVFKKAPDDPWTYQEKLKAIVDGHGQTTAAMEAATILATLNPGPKPGEPVLPPEDAWKTATDLLALADPSKQTVAGKWTLENGALVSAKSGRSKLALPYIAPDEYDLKLLLARVDGNSNLCVNLTHVGTPLTFHLANGNNKIAGWEMLQGKRFGDIATNVQRNNLLENNRRYTLIIQMRKDLWAAFLDGQLLVKRGRDVQTLTLTQFKELTFPNPRQVGLLTNGSVYKVDEFKVLEVTGKGQVLSGAEAIATRESDEPVVAQTPKPVEKPVEVQTKLSAYAVWLKTFHVHWSSRNWAAAKTCVAEALKNPDLESKSSQLKTGQECVILAELAEEATAKGAVALTDGREFVLEDTGKKKYDVGRKTKVLKADATSVTIEQDIGGGKITISLLLSNLTPETRFALTRIGLPDDARGKLALAFHRFADCLKTGTEKTDKTFNELMEQARKASAPAELLNEVQEWQRLRDRERQAAEALAGLEALIAAKKLTESQTALADFIKSFADTACMADTAPRIPELDKQVKALQWIPGLWGRYYSGDQKGKRQKFHFGAPVLNMDHSFGNGPPAKGMPGDNFTLEMTGALRITEAGEYNFSFSGDDSLQLILDSKDHGSNRNLKTNLTVGDHTIKLIFLEGGGGANYRFKWKLPGINDEVKVPANCLFHRQADTEEGKAP